jgi:phytanoyl-CoA hydroxylase
LSLVESGVPLLTDDERDFFAAHGYLVVRGAVSASRVAELVSALDQVLPEQHYARGGGGRPLEVAGISRGSPEIARHTHHRLLAALGADALGASRVQLLQDTALIKAAVDGGRVEWHQDYTYLAYLDEPRAVTLRLALTPCTRESGCLRVIDQSHHWGFQGNSQALAAASVGDALGSLPPELRERARDREVFVELQPGDISLHHCLTFHGSLENRSGRPRKTLVTRLFDTACKLEPSRLPRPESLVHFPTDAAGHFRSDAFPVLYDRAEDE